MRSLVPANLFPWVTSVVMSVLICRVSIDGREMAASWNRNMSCFINIAKLPSKGCHHLQFYEWHVNINVPISLYPHQWQILFLFQKCVANLIGKKWYYMGGFILEEIGGWRPLYNYKYGCHPWTGLSYIWNTYIYIYINYKKFSCNFYTISFITQNYISVQSDLSDLYSGASLFLCFNTSILFCCIILNFTSLMELE